MRFQRLVMGVCVVFGLCGVSAAADEANGPTVTGETGLFTLLDGNTLPRGEYAFAAYFNRWDRGFDNDVTLNLSRLSASFGFGLTDRLEVSAMLPYDDVSFDQSGHSFGSVSGLGRLRFGSNFRLVGLPVPLSAMSVHAFIELPTGDSKVTSDSTGFGAGVAGRFNHFVFDVGVHDPGDAADAKKPSEVLVGAGTDLLWRHNTEWLTEFQLAKLFGDKPPDVHDLFDLSSGLRFTMTSGVQLNLNVRVNLDDPHLGGLIGVTITR